MSFEIPAFAPAAPEIFLLTMACLALVVDALWAERYRLLTYLLAQGTLVVTVLLLMLGFPSERVVTFSGTFIGDDMSSVLKIAIVSVVFVVFYYSRDYLRDRDLLKGEFFILGLFAVLGMMVMVSAGSFLTVYLGLELLSLSLYSMVALHRDSVTASEAAMKYFVLGALASAMLLYGISMVYGVSGSLDLAEVGTYVHQQGRENVILVLGLVFIVVGVAFKLGAVPFHMWVPDVYQGAPTSVTLFIGTAPKMAAFAMLIRLLVDGLGGLQSEWQDMLIILAVLSIGVGNVVAIAQTNIKRMLAYSTIAHMGFLFLGIIAGTPAGYGAAMFYVIVYAIMAMGAFGMIILLSHSGEEADQLDDFRGLSDRSPWFAMLMLILMLSMAGVPPFLGFWAKWSVLREVIASGQIPLAVVAVLFSVIGLFYYLRVCRLMYFDEGGDKSVSAAPDVQVLISANALIILVLGLFPGGLLALCASVFTP